MDMLREAGSKLRQALGRSRERTGVLRESQAEAAKGPHLRAPAAAAADPPVLTSRPSKEEALRKAGELCQEALHSGDYERAEFLFWELLRETPRAPQTTYGLGLAILMQGRFIEARAIIERAYKLRQRLPDRIPARVSEPRVLEVLATALTELPDWDWPKYQLLRERHRALDLTVERAISYLLARKSPLSFVQVGANNGRGDPLTRFVQQRQLSGLFIEPQPTPMAQLKQMYTDRHDLKFEECAIVDSEGQVELFTDPNRTTLGSLVPSRNILADGPKDMQSLKVDGYRLDTVLTKYGISRFDILQIDTEGYDYNVLRQVDLNALGVNLVNMEFYLLPIAERLAAFRTLETYDFVGFFEGMDLLAVRKEVFAREFCVADTLKQRLSQSQMQALMG